MPPSNTRTSSTIRRSVSMWSGLPTIASAHTARSRRSSSAIRGRVGIDLVGALVESLRRRVLLGRLELLLLRVELLASDARCPLLRTRRLPFCFEMAHARDVAMSRGKLTALVELAPLAPAPHDVQDDGSGHDQHDDGDDDGGTHVKQRSRWSSSRHLASV